MDNRKYFPWCWCVHSLNSRQRIHILHTIPFQLDDNVERRQSLTAISNGMFWNWNRARPDPTDYRLFKRILFRLCRFGAVFFLYIYMYIHLCFNLAYALKMCVSFLLLQALVVVWWVTLSNLRQIARLNHEKWGKRVKRATRHIRTGMEVVST